MADKDSAAAEGSANPAQAGYPATGQPGYYPPGQPGQPYPPQGQPMYPGAPGPYGAPPPQGGVAFQGQSVGYAPPPQGYAPPPQGYAPPPQGYAPPPQGYPGGQMYGQPPMNQAQPAMPWMNTVAPIPGCPPGLEYLTQLDQVLIKQQVHLLEVLVNWECANKYKIFNTQGQQCYYAFEKPNIACQQCCGSNRGFEIHVADNTGKTVFTITRPFKCCSGCNWCANMECAQDEVEVTAKDGTTLGYVKQSCSFIRPHYIILDHNKDPKFEIWGPICPCTVCNQNIEFPVQPIGDDKPIANIRKQWSGFANEFFTDADNFGVNFPMDLDVKLKATLMGCVFLIDFMYFEDSPNNNQSH